MKKILLLLLSTPALAGSITLQPGSTITVTPGVATTVSCLAKANSSKAACLCQYNSSNGYWDARMLYGNSNIYMATSKSNQVCLEYLQSLSACK